MLAVAEALGAPRPVRGRTQRGSLLAVLHFTDQSGYDRVIDVLSSPYGLAAATVRKNAIRLKFDLGDGNAVMVAVMSPLDCLASRVENTLLENKQTERADRQLRAAVAIVPAYGRMLLDHGAETRAVTRLNEGVLTMMRRSVAAQRLHERGVDLADALLDDPRLPDAHREIRLPQIRQLLSEAR